MIVRRVFAVVGAAALIVAGIVSPAEARTPVECETHGYYSKSKNITTMWVTTNKPTSKPKFDFRPQFINKRGDIEAIWVKNQPMKISLKGKFHGGYAYQGVDQCWAWGVGVG